ncbi:polysaccharide biosynthesis/export family protein [soil metagenome]
MGIRSAIFVCVLALLSACGGKGGEVIATGDRYVSNRAVVTDYRLGIGDKVRVTVFREPDVSGEFAVAPDGTVALPLIGAVPAVGRRIDELAAEAQARYGDGYLRNPQVGVEVTTFRPFFMLGEVGAQGQYPYSVGLTAFNAIATAQGFTPRADRYIVHIRREGATVEENYRLTPDLRIYPGDTVRVGERFF